MIIISGCQEMKKTPEFYVEISSPSTKYRVEPIFDVIKTKEGNKARLPYGGSSGTWGSSGKTWTEQYGTPIGADITYYSRYEDIYYHFNVDFPADKIDDYMQRAYPVWDDHDGARHNVKAAPSPEGVPAEMKTFKPQ